MKIITKEELVPMTYRKYIANDGTEFLDSSSCQSYEKEQARKNHHLFKTAFENIDFQREFEDMFLEGIYCLLNESDKNLLLADKNICELTRDDYSEPGWYALVVDAWEEDYRLYLLDEFIEEIETIWRKWKKSIFDAIITKNNEMLQDKEKEHDKDI